MKSIFIIAIATLYCSNCFSQKYDYNWVFGDSAGLNFNTIVPSAFNSSIHSFECNASISSYDGDLLFYTNGQQVYSSDHMMMEGGDSLLINEIINSFPSSTTQGVLILPFPNSDSMYYIFYIGSTGLLYSVVNISLNDNKGKVTIKNINLENFYGYSEKMQAVKHANGRDWWLIFFGGNKGLNLLDSLYFIKFQITPDEIIGPIVEYSSILYNNIEDGNPLLGQMKFDLEGKCLAIMFGQNLGLYSFDRCTGEISNTTKIDDITEDYLYGCEFSSDGTKLYVATHGESDIGYIYQYCLDCEIEDLEETQTLIYNNEGGGSGFGKAIGSFQIGPNHKIYITSNYSGLKYYDSIPQNLYLNVINNPNELGLDCDFDTLSIWLGGNRVTYGLPNMPNYNLGALAGSECDTLVSIENIEVEKNTIRIYPNPSNGILYFTGNIPTESKIEITGIDGKIVYQEFVSENVWIDISDISQGFYIIKILSKDGILFEGKLFMNNSNK